MDDVVKLITPTIQVAKNLFENKVEKWISRGAWIANLANLSSEGANGWLTLEFDESIGIDFLSMYHTTIGLYHKRSSV